MKNGTVIAAIFLAISGIVITTMLTYNLFGVTSVINRADRQLVKQQKTAFTLTKK